MQSLKHAAHARAFTYNSGGDDALPGLKRSADAMGDRATCRCECGTVLPPGALRRRPHGSHELAIEDNFNAFRADLSHYLWL